MQHILGLVRRCVEDYNMIEAGETVAVGVSGGKDSLLTLTALARLRAFGKPPGVTFSSSSVLFRAVVFPIWTLPVKNRCI